MGPACGGQVRFWPVDDLQSSSVRSNGLLSKVRPDVSRTLASTAAAACGGLQSPTGGLP